MKIKRIICLILCLVMSALVLASCEDDIITEAQAEKDKLTYKPDVLDEAELNLYIITNGVIHNSTTVSVERSINQYLEGRAGRKFDTKLNIVYYNETTGESSEKDVNGDLVKYASYSEFLAGKTEGIVLITSEAQLDAYIANDQLADMNPYFEDDSLVKKYEFAKLAASLYKTNPKLLDFAKDVVDEKEKLFFVPNNRVMGSYDYVLINEYIARELLYYTEDELQKIEWNDEQIANLKDKFLENESKILALYPEFNVDKAIIKAEDKKYEDRFDYTDDGYICCVMNNPELTRSELAEAGFAILKPAGFDPYLDVKDITDPAELEEYTKALKEYEIYEAAAMEIVYLINADVEMRNLLLYGKEGVNYSIKNGVVVPQEKDGNRYYIMDLKYTGDIFLAHFCESEGRSLWTKDMKDFGLKQNSECVAK